MKDNVKYLVLFIFSIFFLSSVGFAVLNIRYDTNNDNYISFAEPDCQQLNQAGVPLLPDCTEDFCIGCRDAEGNPIWCGGSCKVLTGNYAIYLATHQTTTTTTTSNPDDLGAKVHWLMLETLTYNDCSKLCRDDIPNNMFSECLEAKFGSRIQKLIDKGKCPSE